MHKQIILKVPEHIKEFRNNKKTVCIDEKIVDVIKHLWSKKIITLGCCQGIPEYMDNRPNIIISNEYKKTDIDQIKVYIKEIDNRHFAILQWNLIEV